MYVYKIDDLINSLKSSRKDGFEYVSISVLSAENDMPESIDLDYVDSTTSSETDSIDSLILPDDYIANLRY